MQSDTLRLFRISQNLKQKTVADILKMSQPNYSNLENGKTKLTSDAAIKLAAYYGVNRDVFFSTSAPFIHMGAVSTSSQTIHSPSSSDTDEDMLEPVLQRMDMLLNLLADEKEVLAQERKQLSDVFDKLAQTFGIRM